MTQRFAAPWAVAQQRTKLTTCAGDGATPNRPEQVHLPPALAQAVLAGKLGSTGVMGISPGCWVTKWQPSVDLASGQRQPALPARSGFTRNRRDMSAMSMVPPPQQIGMNEMLIRMGAAGLEAQRRWSRKSGAMGDAYAGAQDANRATGLAAYQAQMEALKDGKDARRTRRTWTQTVGQIDEALFDMDRAMGFSKRRASVTGWTRQHVRCWLRQPQLGNPDRARRLLLEKLRVDDAMLRVAQTKGAISNKEMELFLAPAPKDIARRESVWIEWIKIDRKHCVSVRSRLATGTTGCRSSIVSTGRPVLTLQQGGGVAG